MSGLVYKDLLAYVRKTRKFTWVMEFFFLLFFIIGIKHRISVFTFCLLVTPVNASGMATTLKELDINYSGRFNLTLPFSHKELVLSRFLSVFSVHILYAMELLVFSVVRYFVYGDFPFPTYLAICAAGVLVGICMTALNLLASFTASLNTSAVLYLVIIAVFLVAYLIALFTGLNIENLLQMSAGFILAAGTALTTAIVLISYALSVRIYIKKLG